MTEYKLYHNEPENRFEFHIEGETPLLAYIPVSEKIWVLDHTEVPEDLEGHGVGNALVQESLDEIRKEGRKIVPTCPFVQDFIMRHPQYEDMVIAE